ncbi:MAG: Omp28-related outer membrane protein [Bacteroidetes bacterium]|nr:Omp28-related outer membrane protein [Bacteroidota bacterium]
MKYNFLLILSAALIISSCKDDEVTPKVSSTASDKQVATGFFFTGTWAKECGDYAVPAVKNLGTKYPNDFAYIGIHGNGSGTDPFANSYGDEFQTLFNNNQIPTLIFGGNSKALIAMSNNVNFEHIADSIIQTYKALKPTATLSIINDIEDGAISTTINTKFIEATSDEYTLSVYLVESNLKQDQTISSGTLSNFEHNNVLRKRMSADVKGDALKSGAKAAGDVVTTILGDFLDSSWVESNVHIVAVLWKKSGNNYLLVNSAFK